MRYGLGRVRLDEIDGGTLMSGLVPWTRLIKHIRDDDNTGLVTVLATDTVITTVTPPNVEVNEKIIVYVCVNAVQKGGVAGATRLTVKQTGGTATMRWLNHLAGATGVNIILPNHPAGSIWAQAFMAIATVDSAGSLTIDVVGASGGSNSTVNAGDGCMVLIISK